MGDQLLCNADDEHYNGVHTYTIYIYTDPGQTSIVLCWPGIPSNMPAKPLPPSLQCRVTINTGWEIVSTYLRTYLWPLHYSAPETRYCMYMGVTATTERPKNDPPISIQWVDGGRNGRMRTAKEAEQIFSA